MHVTNACAGQVFLTVYNDGAVGEGSSVVSPSAVVHTALERCSECPRYRVAAEVLPISKQHQFVITTGHVEFQSRRDQAVAGAVPVDVRSTSF